MLKKWKALDDLECVKMYGHNHKMAHMMGTHSYSKCVLAIGRWAMEGFIVGLEAEVEPEQRERVKKAFDQFKE
ncbi:hypothetical protein MKY15_20660 [Sporosarcina sp. FSL K6-1540]|uniref:hypothetical protein n=1 Tax=Sporosarcina sp. FSL K6-1540 TaxID=2921555 RepID=UPI00315AF3F9